jgi:hypothetical protein
MKFRVAFTAYSITDSITIVFCSSLVTGCREAEEGRGGEVIRRRGDKGTRRQGDKGTRRRATRRGAIRRGEVG